MKKRALFTLVVAGLAWSTAATCLATPITQVHLFGTENLDCTSEMDPDCAAIEVLPDGPNSIGSNRVGPYSAGNVFTNTFDGGYRSGGHVAWDFFFNPSAFTTINSMTLDVDVVGFVYQSGNIDPQNGRIGDYFAIDGVPFAPMQNNTDGRDLDTFVLPILAPGAHEFSVWAFDFIPGDEGPYKFGEGWAGVDFAKLTIVGDGETQRSEEGPAAVPEPASLVLLGSGLLGIAKLRRRFVQRS